MWRISSTSTAYVNFGNIDLKRLYMKNSKSKLQKSAIYIAVISFLMSVACVVYLFLNIDDLGWGNTISASLLASTFFFAFVGFVLMVIGTANLPSFKFDDSSNNS